MDIRVQVRQVYGVDKIYPVNAAAETLAAIAGTKTLSRDDLANATKLGLTVIELTVPKLGAIVEVWA